MARRKSPPREAEVRVPEGAFDDAPPIGTSGPMPEVLEWRKELTTELLEMLCVAARIGGFKRQTALACGVKPEMLEFWLSEGMREDGPALMRELSARYQQIQSNVTLGYLDIVNQSARSGCWEAALRLMQLRDPLWSGREKVMEAETSSPKTSLADRREAFLAELKNPQGDLAKLLTEAGYPLPARETPESPELHALLERARDGNRSDE